MSMASAPNIVAIERVIVAVADLEGARDRWSQAGFAIAPGEVSADGVRFLRMAAGAVEIDLAAAPPGESDTPLATTVADKAAVGGGIVGWIWGYDSPLQAETTQTVALPRIDGASFAAQVCPPGMPAVFTASATIAGDIEARRAALREVCGVNANTVDYLEHIVVRTPVMEDAIAANEAMGVPCKRIRDAGHGAHQAFFKLEQTVIEVVAPAHHDYGCWGLALMCSDIQRAVDHARASGLEATEPKAAIQGGMIARIVNPLDGVAIAFMQPGPRRAT
jgi:predicted enzyme related to lactoylglutathione lyase